MNQKEHGIEGKAQVGENRDTDIFGAVRMGYLVVGSRKLDAWKQFLTEAIGLHLAHEAPGELAFRMDEHARRLIIEEDPAEDAIAVGWELDDESVLRVILDRLEAKGVKVDFVDDEVAARRGVESLHRFAGPKGMSIELFTRPLLVERPLEIPGTGFNIGAAGMGHMSFMSREPERSIAFWQDLFDARISDRIELSAGRSVILDVTFLRVNQRHHSIAIAATRGMSIDFFRTRVQHVNLEVATLDDLSSTYERCKALGYRFARSVGQHPNDKELSFYVVTPSGFDLEIGWDALAVDEVTWQPGKTYPNMSTWGHDIPGMFSSDLSFSHLVRGARSLTKTEFLPW